MTTNQPAGAATGTTTVEVVGDQLQVNQTAIPGITCEQTGDGYMLKTAQGYSFRADYRQLQQWAPALAAVASFGFGSGGSSSS